MSRPLITERMGAFFGRDREPTNEQKGELVDKVNLSARLSALKGSDAYLFGYLPLIKARRDKLINDICNLGLKEKHEETAIRIDELDGIAKKIEEAIAVGQKAQLQLEIINKPKKETA